MGSSNCAKWGSHRSGGSELGHWEQRMQRQRQQQEWVHEQQC